MSIEITSILADVWFQRLDSAVAEKRILIIAEAYADARVREALEEVEDAITSLLNRQTSVRGADAIAVIRALIPMEKQK